MMIATGRWPRKRALLLALALFTAGSYAELVAATGLPAWVGRGADDDAWPHDVQASMAERLGVQIHVIPDSAHSPAVENPQGLADAWIPFLSQN